MSEFSQTLILLPGLDGTGDLFADFASELRAFAEPQIIRYPVDRELGYQDLLALIEAQLPTGPFVVLGESFSGPLALRLAAKRTWPIRGVILCASFARYPLWRLEPLSFLLDVPGVMGFPRTTLFRSIMGRRIGAPLLQAMNAANAKVAPNVIRYRIRELLRNDSTPELLRINVPMLYLRARYDYVVPGSAVRHILHHRPDVKVVDFDCSHYILQTLPRESAKSVKGFVGP